MWEKSLAFAALLLCLSWPAWSEPEPGSVPDFRTSVNSLASELQPTLTPWQRTRLTQLFQLFEDQSTTLVQEAETSKAQATTLSESLDRERETSAREALMLKVALGTSLLACLIEGVALAFRR